MISTHRPGDKAAQQIVSVALLCVLATVGCAAAPAIEIPDGAPMAVVLADAAKRTGVAASRIKVLSAEKVTWRDGSMGCPEPGGFYPQALVPGFRIRLMAGGDTLDYHTDARRGQIVFCPTGRAQAPLPVPG
jgi:hypothetical protein